MSENIRSVLKEKMEQSQFQRLTALRNPKLEVFVAEAIELCNPATVFVCTDSQEDSEYIRKRAIETGDEEPLKTEGHTVHFDGYHDQARDKDNTKYLVPEGVDFGAEVNSVGRDVGLAEVKEYLRNTMVGREMYVRFVSLGPIRSPFTVCGVQITDSSYVAHSDDMLYRPGYEQFKLLNGSGDFFRVLHSSGRLEGGVSADIDKRRIYIDIEDEIVYSVNTQYAGNTVGFKKLCLRLAIRKASREGWLAEHMFIMGVKGPNGRKTYFSGAFPSMCGKTSTAMIPGETIVGDDLAYLRAIEEQARAVNVESGVFGIIQGVNAKDDPIIWKVLHSPGEVIFSNVLVADGVPYWVGDGREHPERGRNFSGEWQKGKKDEKGKEIPASHKNARYTIRLSALDNLDELADAPEGVLLGGIIYGGRDSDTSVPVRQSFDWTHGVIIMGAGLESETTAATLGQAGVRKLQPMSNLDFVSIPLGRYVQNHLEFAKKLSQPPLIFAVNYFLKENPEDEHSPWLNDKSDKYVWVKWMERRVHGDLDAIETPVGYIPKLTDLQQLFREVFPDSPEKHTYSEEDYVKQFTIRVPENLSKLDRIEKFYREKVTDTPQVLFDVLNAERQRLKNAQAKYGNYISPLALAT